MTRGTFYLITDKNVYQSVEFNGDMYGSPKDSKNAQQMGYYKEVIARLSKVKTPRDFKAQVVRFNAENFNYQDKELVYKKNKHDFFKGQAVLDLSDSYFDRFFSDYLYFKNVSNQPVLIKPNVKRKKVIILSPGETATFNFGRFIEVYSF